MAHRTSFVLRDVVTATLMVLAIRKNFLRATIAENPDLLSFSFVGLGFRSFRGPRFDQVLFPGSRKPSGQVPEENEPVPAVVFDEWNHRSESEKIVCLAPHQKSKCQKLEARKY